jgi:hypothetical protein
MINREEFIDCLQTQSKILGKGFSEAPMNGETVGCPLESGPSSPFKRGLQPAAVSA